MDYSAIYEAFISSRRARPKPTGYSERHHIIPRSMGGTDDPANLIELEPGEHYFAHLCLAKIHGGAQWGAVHCMASMVIEATKTRNRLASRYMVAVARKKFAQAQSERYTGKRRPDRDRIGTIYHLDGRTVTGSRTQIAKATGQSIASVSRLMNGAQGATYSGWYVDRGAMKAAVSSKRANGLRSASNVAGVNSRPVLHIERGTVYNSLTAAANENGTATANISRAIRTGGRAAGTRWAYA